MRCQHVLIATPTTLLALLHSVAYGWQQERVAEEARRLRARARAARAAREALGHRDVGKRLNSTVAAYNEAVGSYEAGAAERAAVRRHGAVARGAELPDVEQMTVQPRSESRAEDERAIGGDTRPIVRRRCRGSADAPLARR